MNILILRILLLFSSLIFSIIVSAQIEYGDVIISELMIDPSPTKHLPSEEYIEIQNRCIDTINLDQLINTVSMISPFSVEEKQKLIETIKIEDKIKILSEIISFNLIDFEENKTVQ